MANMYNCSDGSKVSQATIDRKRSETYQRIYSDNMRPLCLGCYQQAQGSAHCIPQSVLKSEGMAELCWAEDIIIPTCYKCNSIIESIKGDEIKRLHCYEYVLQITKKYLPSRYEKMVA